MKFLKLLPIALVFTTISVKAQKIGVVDTEYILSQLPQYKEAQDRLNKLIVQWQGEVQSLQADYEAKKATLENERVLLVGEQLKQREKEVADLDKKIKNILAGRFGAKGEINNSRSNLAKPFQDQIWNAIKTVQEKNSLGIILDKTEDNVLFLDKKYDYTEKVLNLLVKNQPAKKEETKSGSLRGAPQNGTSFDNNAARRTPGGGQPKKARQDSRLENNNSLK